MAIQDLSQIKYDLIKKAITDQSFKNLLLGGQFDPKQVVEQNTTHSWPSTTTMTVYQETQTQLYLVLPAKEFLQVFPISYSEHPITRLISKASANQAFYNALVNNTKATIEQFLNITLPTNLTVTIKYDTVNAVSLVLPPDDGYFDQGKVYDQVVAIKAPWKGSGGGCKPAGCSMICLQGTLLSNGGGCTNNTACPTGTCIATPGDPNPTVGTACAPTDLCTAYGSNLVF